MTRTTQQPKHRIVTVERGDAYADTGDRIGPGYAARCEFTHADGTVELCSITFGGFPNRSTARAACRAAHDEATSAWPP